MSNSIEQPNADDICSRCGKTKTKSTGSITQWISGCKCAELNELERGGADQSRPTSCATCGKKIESGRPGSLTQWVFRQDICACRIGGADLPAQFQNQESSVDFGKELDTAGDTAIQEEEITVDRDRFPIERYAPLAELGKGASGTVYLCRDRLLGTKVAVKCLNNVTAEQLLSFQLEAKATSRLNHANIVKVINFDVTESGSPYMVMEYFPSVSLSDLIAESGGLAWNTLSGIVEQVVDGLIYAHQHDIFHRDLKPSNILLQQSDQFPQIRIIDFGVALVKNITPGFSQETVLSEPVTVNQGPAFNQGQTLVGTPEYMSPDQVSGIAYDARSEIYSLGCLLFESATGRPPFQGNTALELINQHAQATPPRLSELTQHEFPTQFESLVAQMLDKDPDSRPQTMDEVKKRLAAVEQSQSSFIKVETNRGGKRLKNSSHLLIALGAASLVIVSLAAVSYLMQLQSNRELAVRKIERVKQRIKRAREIFSCVDIEFDGAFEKGWKPLDPTTFTDEDLQYFPPLLRGKDQIKQLDLSRTSIRGTGLRHLSNSNIVNINLAHTHMDLIGYQNLAKIRPLKKVILNRTPVDDLQLAALTGLPNVRNIHLEHCKNLTVVGLRELTESKSLVVLDLSGTNVTEQVMIDLQTLPHLATLYLDETAITDEGLKYLQALDMKDLRLVSCRNLTGNSLKIIATQWPSITTIELDSNRFPGESLLDLAPCTKLRHLNLVGIPVDDRTMAMFGTFKSLRTLYITNGTFGDDSLRHLYGLTQLKTLSLMRCQKLTDNGIMHLKKHLQTTAIMCPTRNTITFPSQFQDMYKDEALEKVY